MEKPWKKIKFGRAHLKQYFFDFTKNYYLINILRKPSILDKQVSYDWDENSMII